MESEQTLLSAISQITALDAGAMDAARKRQAELAKPPGSLGLLEDISVQLAGITGSVKNTIQKTRIYVLAADNGVVDEGVSSAPQSVTLAQSINLTRGLTGASCLAKHFGDELVVVDMGIRLPYHCPEIVNRSLGKGTKNFYKDPAMTRAQAVAGIAAGMALAAQAKKDGVSILGVGEMGIGNTTTSSAVLAALTGASIEDVTGRGGGLTDAAFLKKKEVISHALALHKPDSNDPIDVLSKVGGFDLCAMTGVFLGAARQREAMQDVYGAWEELQQLRSKDQELFINDQELNAQYLDLTTKASTLVNLLNDAEKCRNAGEVGSALGKYMEAKKLYLYSRFAKEGIESLLNEVLPLN